MREKDGKLCRLGSTSQITYNFFYHFYLATLREAFYAYCHIIHDQATHPPGARRSGPMSIPPESPKHPLGAAQIERWVQTATNKRLALLLCAAEPLYLARAEAFTEMADSSRMSLKNYAWSAPPCGRRRAGRYAGSRPV